MINFEENFPNSQKVFEKKSIEVAPNDARFTTRVDLEAMMSGEVFLKYENPGLMLSVAEGM
jgi:hypothetical protein